jgi:hypothetical protein
MDFVMVTTSVIGKKYFFNQFINPTNVHACVLPQWLLLKEN